MEKINRRHLSGIYILHKFEDEERKQPTCFEDCPEDRQFEWLNSLDNEALKDLAIMLGFTLRNIGDKFNIIKD
jgi:hypothetical protein